jgi:hypothetical protein
MSERGEYRAIYTVLLDSPEFLKLKPGARLMLYTLKMRLGPSGIGVIPALLANLGEASGMTAVQVADAMSELEGGGWIRTEGNVVWIINGLKYEPSISAKNINHRASVISYLNSLPRLKIVDAFRRYYAEWLQIEPPAEEEQSALPHDDDVLTADSPLRRPANGTKPKKPRTIPNSWVADGVAWWTENVGTINHGRFGTALKLLVDKYGWERVFASLQTYVANEDKQVRIEWFASNGVRLIEAGTTTKKSTQPAWKQEEYDRGMNAQKSVIERVNAYKQSLGENGDAWMKLMQEQAKQRGRWVMVYAWENIPTEFQRLQEQAAT